MNNEQRIIKEQEIVAKYIRAMKNTGFVPILMNTGDEWKDYTAADIFEADECVVEFKQPDDNRNLALHFVFGNEPGEVLCDYSSNPKLKAAIKEVDAYAEKWS